MHAGKPEKGFFAEATPPTTVHNWPYLLERMGKRIFSSS